MPNKNSIESAIKKTADYLYKIVGDCSPELYQAIDRLRQLTNEEFVGKNKQVSSQLIYDTLIEAIQREVKKGSEKSSTCISPNCDNYVGGYCAECNRLWET